jgi:predicted nuclease of restriction endonuclease-like (RecB) superfamily
MNNIEDNKNYINLINNIEENVKKAKQSICRNINTVMIETYWNIGRYIVEYEQNGDIRAKYKNYLYKKLSEDLTLRLGKGFRKSNIYKMRKFYEYYPIFQTVSGKLTWSHLCEIISIENELERDFYIAQSIKDNWSVRELKRQKEAGLFLKIAINKNKEDILRISEKGTDKFKKEDIIKDIYTLDFLGLPTDYSESKLEEAIINNIQQFLLELGKGFAFVGRQYRLTVDNEHYYADLVFYHIYLKCYVVIDLKTRKLKHTDISQLNMYLGYFAIDVNIETDNPPIGIILATDKDETLVEYATYNMKSNLFVSKFELYLPNKDELQELVNRTISECESSE